MQPFKIQLKDLGNGLVPTKESARNMPYLIESIGAFPYEKMLMAVEQFKQMDTTALNVPWPYPQMFVMSDVIVVCTATEIYELTSAGLVLKLSGLTEGTTWSCADWKGFVVLMNARQVIVRDMDSMEYAVDTRIPIGACVGNYNNARLFVGSSAKYITYDAVGVI